MATTPTDTTTATAHKALALAGGALGVLVAVLHGQVEAGVADGPTLRVWLQSLVDGLPLDERQRAYGHCLQRVIAGLDGKTAEWCCTDG